MGVTPILKIRMFTIYTDKIVIHRRTAPRICQGNILSCCLLNKLFHFLLVQGTDLFCNKLTILKHQ